MTRIQLVRNSIFTLLCAAQITGCSFVDTVPGSERVVISSDTQNCKKLGETHVEVLSEIVGIDRNTDAMAEELSILARNAAFERGSNTITPISDIVDGRQSFALFRCPN